MGYIMQNRHMAMGMETTGAPLTEIARPSSASAKPGAARPKAIPAAMHSTTHTVR